MGRIEKKSVLLVYNKGLTTQFILGVSGEYYKGTPDTYMEKGDDPEFELETVELYKGNLYDLLEKQLTIDCIVKKVFEELG